MNNNEVRNSPADDHNAVIRQKSVFTSPLLIATMSVVSAAFVVGNFPAAGDLNLGIYHPVCNSN